MTITSVDRARTAWMQAQELRHGPVAIAGAGRAELHGRGAWNPAGVGGTLSYDGLNPGGYYRLPKGSSRPVGEFAQDNDHRAVRGAVDAYRTALERRLSITIDAGDGTFTAQMADAVYGFQMGLPNVTPWGGVGPDTAKALLSPDIVRITHQAGVPATIVCGIITTESSFDGGAIGYVDPEDVGLAQINGPAHPEYTFAQRLKSGLSIRFVASTFSSALAAFEGNQRDAVSSYNLGIGGWSSQYERLVGTRGWIADGRPDSWTPPGSSSPRDVKAYIDHITSVCTL